MHSLFTTADWLVFIAYFGLLVFLSWYFSRDKVTTTRGYFLGDNTMPSWAVAISVLATAQSAATFLGGPDSGYRSNLTYLATNIGAILGAIFVARVLLPRFYAMKASTVYELLEVRFGKTAKHFAGVMYLVGRVFASGSRLFMGAIAVAMILFSNIDAGSVMMSLAILVVVGLAYTYLGGIRSIIWTDTIQFLVYFGAAIAVLVYLYSQIPADFSTIINALQNPGDGKASKLVLFDFSTNLGPSGAFSVWASITGFTLLSIAAFGMDQDMTQRALTCKNSSDAAKAMINSSLLTVPVVFIFMCVGLLLYIFYQRPDIMGGGGKEVVQTFSGEKITIFMYYVLNEMPAGLKGLVTVGVIAATLSTLNSGINAMSSVAIQDIYRPYLEKRGIARDEMHYVRAGRHGMTYAAIALGLMAALCYYWQRHTDMPLLNFALSVMVFSYTGLLGVYFTAVFTKRGSEKSVLAALIVGFLVTLLLQPYVWDAVMKSINGAWVGKHLAFPYQLCVGTAIAFAVCQLGNAGKAQTLGARP